MIKRIFLLFIYFFSLSLNFADSKIVLPNFFFLIFIIEEENDPWEVGRIVIFPQIHCDYSSVEIEDFFFFVYKIRHLARMAKLNYFNFFVCLFSGIMSVSPSLKDLPKVNDNLKSELQRFNQENLKDVNTLEKNILPSAQGNGYFFFFFFFFGEWCFLKNCIFHFSRWMAALQLLIEEAFS